jgi:hypothetical protein
MNSICSSPEGLESESRPPNTRIGSVGWQRGRAILNRGIGQWLAQHPRVLKSSARAVHDNDSWRTHSISAMKISRPGRLLHRLPHQRRRATVRRRKVRRDRQLRDGAPGWPRRAPHGARAESVRAASLAHPCLRPLRKPRILWTVALLG